MQIAAIAVYIMFGPPKMELFPTPMVHDDAMLASHYHQMSSVAKIGVWTYLDTEQQPLTCKTSYTMYTLLSEVMFVQISLQREEIIKKRHHHALLVQECTNK